MPSSYNYMGMELMVTGENAGTWGNKTNTNLNIIQQAATGYHSQVVSGTGTTTLAITDGDDTSSTDSLTNAARNVVINLTGTITGNIIVTVPNGVEKVYYFINSTSGVYTVQVKGASDSGSGMTFTTTDKGLKLCYMNGQDLTEVSLGGGGTSWQAVKTNSDSPVTSASGEGYFLDTSGGAITINLPTTPSLGDEIRFIDYGATFDTHNLTVGRNSHKIQGLTADLVVATARAAFGLVYVNATQGWLLTEK